MSNLRYKDKVTIITGGSSGIGKGCANEFVKAGARVVICCNDGTEGSTVTMALDELAQRQGAGEAFFTFCDVRNTEDIQRLIADTASRYGKIDCLINNAGWHPAHKPIDEFSVEEFRDLLNLNLVSVFTACKFALPHLRAAKGNIINMSSLVATMGQKHATTYVATKGAITAFTKALAIDESPLGVRVNSVSPGNIYTPLWQEAIDAAPDPELFRSEGEAAQVVGRLGRADEVARLCLFIAAEATFTTGVDHIISGGAELGYGRKSVSLNGQPTQKEKAIVEKLIKST
ncbi:MAG TPA: SDR family oxidoreductase [Pyrinomonadaceae bacterium]|nr:SDR family oxidoreductase [Pyrinomonadaceae bacterium]